jgi:hypothetical protein
MTVLERLDTRLDDVSRRAEEIRVGRIIALVVGGLFFGLGWVCGKFTFGIRWVLAAFMEGFEQGRLVSRGSTRTD